jgi:hypothetical protein
MSAVLSAVPVGPTMPSGLGQGEEQRLDAIAIALRVHYGNLQISMAHIAWQTGDLLAIVPDSGQADRVFCEVTSKSPSTFRKYRRAALAIGRTGCTPAAGSAPAGVGRNNAPRRGPTTLGRRTASHKTTRGNGEPPDGRCYAAIISIRPVASGPKITGEQDGRGRGNQLATESTFRTR